MIHIGRAGKNLGSFSEEEVRRGLVTGRFSPTDLGWKEGMDNWAPLSQFEELAALPPPEEEAPPLPEETPAAEALAGEGAGLPWDEWHVRGLVMGFAGTARMVLTRPVEAFARMRTSGSLANPLLYNLIGGWLGLIIAGVYAVVTSRLQQPSRDLSQMQAIYGSPAMAMRALKWFAIMGPVFVTMMTMVSAVLAHLFLMLAGGANKPFHVTLRVFCFSFGSTMLLELVPFCGGLLGMAWLLVCGIVGLTVAHGTTTGRSVAAMVFFMAACFACCMGIFLLAAAANYQVYRTMLNH